MRAATPAVSALVAPAAAAFGPSAYAPPAPAALDSTATATAALDPTTAAVHAALHAALWRSTSDPIAFTAANACWAAAAGSNAGVNACTRSNADTSAGRIPGRLVHARLRR